MLVCCYICSEDEIVGEWRSLVAHLFWVQGVASSNLVSPTILSNAIIAVHFLD